MERWEEGESRWYRDEKNRRENGENMERMFIYILSPLCIGWWLFGECMTGYFLLLIIRHLHWLIKRSGEGDGREEREEREELLCESVREEGEGGGVNVVRHVGGWKEKMEE